MGARSVRIVLAGVLVGAGAALMMGQAGGGGSGMPATTMAAGGSMGAGGGSSAAATAPSDLKVSMMDGSVVAGKLSVPDIAIETKYGLLKVPVEQIHSFAPGLQSHPEFQGRIGALVNDLSADAFVDREKAQAALMRLGPEIQPELQRLLKGATEVEKQNRLQKIMEDFDSSRGGGGSEEVDHTRDWVVEDVIVTQGFTIVGRIMTPGFAIKSQYGTLQVKLSDVREARREVGGEPEDIRKTVMVNGSLIAQRGFTSSVRVNKGDQITVTAGGSIKMTPWGSRASSGPDGAPNYGTSQPGNMPAGCLMARIGGDSTPIKVGSKLTFTADKSGSLDFGIAMPPDYTSYQFPGEYEVKIRVVRKP